MNQRIISPCSCQAVTSLSHVIVNKPSQTEKEVDASGEIMSHFDDVTGRSNCHSLLASSCRRLTRLLDVTCCRWFFYWWVRSHGCVEGQVVLVYRSAALP